MPDIRASNAPGNVTSDLKVRAAFDIEGGDNGQFLDVMIARLSAAQSAGDADPKAPKISAADPSRDSAYLSRLKALRNADKTAAADASAKVQPKAELKEKIKAKIAELAQRNETPVKDDRALKALKKVADFLLKAEEQGKIELPPELSQKLEEFLAKGDDLKAADVVIFMHDFIRMFKELNVVLPAPVLKPAPAAAENAAPQGEEILAVDVAVQDEAELVWPKEIADAFRELKLGGMALANQPVTTFQLLKAIKALVSNGERAALATLDEKEKTALMAQPEAQILVPNASVEKIAAVLPAAMMAAADENLAAAQSVKDAGVRNLVVQAVVAAAPLQIKPAKVELAARPVAEAELSAASDGALHDLLDLQPDNLDNPLLPHNNKDARKSDNLLRELASQPSNNQTPVQNAPAQSAAAVIAAAARAEARVSPDAKGSETVAAVNADLAAQNLDSDAGPLSSPHNAGRFARALNAASAAQAAQPGTATQQVLVQIQNRANKSSQINLQLSPAELGRVDIRLNVGRDGQAYAVVMADKPETLSLLQKDASLLEKALQQAGLNASQENMSFNLREQRQQSGGFAGRKRLGRESAIEAPAADLALNVHSDGQIISDTRVNYHA